MTRSSEQARACSSPRRPTGLAQGRVQVFGLHRHRGAAQQPRPSCQYRVPAPRRERLCPGAGREYDRSSSSATAAWNASLNSSRYSRLRYPISRPARIDMRGSTISWRSARATWSRAASPTRCSGFSDGVRRFARTPDHGGRRWDGSCPRRRGRIWGELEVSVRRRGRALALGPRVELGRRRVQVRRKPSES